MKRFRDVLGEGGKFVITFELIPARASKGKSVDAILAFAQAASGSGLLDAVSLTDNPGGGPALSPDMLGHEIAGMGMETIIHVSAKDSNRNRLEARALALSRLGLDNLLVMTGDYPTPAEMGQARPVFDMDSVQLIRYLSCMNDGIPVDNPKRPTVLPEPTDFFLGCVVSPFKATEPETITQYYKLEKKIAAGARYVVTQVGYDTRKYRELLAYMLECGLDTPVMGSVFVLTRGAANVMNCGNVPGCLVTDELCSLVKSEAAADDKGKGSALERAARQVAILKGLGYKGAHIEGFMLKYDDARTIVERAEEIGDNWPEYESGFRYLPSSSFFISDKPSPPVPKPVFRPRRNAFLFHMMRAVHSLIFVKGTPGFSLMKSLSAWLERHVLFHKLFYSMERVSKVMLFDCRDCGDCALPEMLYLCPESQCPKFQRVGPCGGSRLGRCEVYDDRFCVWYEIYLRAKKTGRLEHLRTCSFLPRNWELHATSSWTNYYLGKDHTAKD